MTECRAIVLAVLCAAVLSVGCGEPTGPHGSDFSFTLSASSWVPGDTLRGSLQNAGDREAIYNFCGTALDRRTGSEWAEAAASVFSPDGVCAAIGFRLLPGESADFTWAIPDTLSAGTYRVRTGVAVHSGDRYTDRWVPTGPFMVTF
jgi:hypothetical protein